jgi:hypothetical protein
MADFRAAASLWRWQRQMEGLPTGDWERTPALACCADDDPVEAVPSRPTTGLKQ